MITGMGSRGAKVAVALLAMALFLPAVLADEAASPPGPTVNMTDVPVRDLIHDLAKANGVNVMMTDKVGGTVTITVSNQPFESLLSSICELTGLTWRKNSQGVYLVDRVAPQPEQVAETSKASSSGRGKRVVREFVYLGWWHCNDLAYLFDGITTPHTPGLTGAVPPVFPYGIGPVTPITEASSPLARAAAASSGPAGSGAEKESDGQAARRTSGTTGGATGGGLWEQFFQYPTYPTYPGAPGVTGVTPGVARPGVTGMPGEVSAARAPLESAVPGAYGPLSPLLPEGLYAPPIAFLPLNALIVMGEEEAVREFQDLIAQLDVKVRQVNIEVQLVSVSLQEVQAWGVEWQWVGGNTTIQSALGTAAATLQIGYSRENLLVNLAAAVTQSRARVIQAFSVTAINNFPATIFTSSSFPVITTTAITTPGALGGVAATTEAVNIQYLTIPSSFTVTPRINADDTITAFLTPVFVTIGPSTELPDGGSIPQISSQTASSLVRVKDGETFVMGGTLVKNWTKSMSKIPLLSDIPLIGPTLFTRTSISQSEDEVFFFVTPRIQEEETPGAPTATVIP